MTYCLALRLDDGLVFLADTRTNAGVDNVSSYRKLHTFEPAPDRVFVIESAGNLASTQQVLDRTYQDLANPDSESLATVRSDGTSTFILGGQIAGERPDILLIYPQGNYIRASDDRPFLQIGETKYGKLMPELAVKGESTSKTTRPLPSRR